MLSLIINLKSSQFFKLFRLQTTEVWWCIRSKQISSVWKTELRSKPKIYRPQGVYYKKIGYLVSNYGVQHNYCRHERYVIVLRSSGFTFLTPVKVLSRKSKCKNLSPSRSCIGNVMAHNPKSNVWKFLAPLESKYTWLVTTKIIGTQSVTETIFLTQKSPYSDVHNLNGKSHNDISKKVSLLKSPNFYLKSLQKGLEDLVCF